MKTTDRASWIAGSIFLALGAAVLGDKVADWTGAPGSDPIPTTTTTTVDTSSYPTTMSGCLFAFSHYAEAADIPFSLYAHCAALASE